MIKPDCQVAIIGAGPYGLAAAAHLRAANVELRVFGRAMEFWEHQMPKGMFLRSYWHGSHISDPQNSLTLDDYQSEIGVPLQRPVRLEDFVNYGQWFQRKVVPDADGRRVYRVERSQKCFRLTLDDGDLFYPERIVVATGIGAFAFKPPQFNDLPLDLASHVSDHRDLSRFSGQSIIVVGGGQSALESAALLQEVGATVEVITRASTIHWLRHGTPLHNWLHRDGNLLGRILYPPSDIGPPGLNWLVDTPDLFRHLPYAVHARIAKRAIRPAGAGWLRSRLNGVNLTTNRVIVSARPVGRQVYLSLNDGSMRLGDHVLLASGYRIDVSRYSFLSPELLKGITLVDGYPKLRAGFESSVAGLHFLGASAARSYGPLMRFVAGTKYAAASLTNRILESRPAAINKKATSYPWHHVPEAPSES